MTGKLTDKQMDQLEQWIGTGPKTFTLLYTITRDGCNGNTFHQKCNNQGATVTVLYNPQGFVYGGYAPVSWSSSNTWINNAAAFLYQLQASGTDKRIKFPIKPAGPKNAMYDHQNYGPVFGGGHDLHTFTNTINSSGTYFTLNGNMDGFGYSYDNQGMNANQINNGSMNVTEVEVYDYQSCGPIFGCGDGHDLYTFSNTVNSSGTYFTLNGNMNKFGDSYDNQEMNANQINNGNMNVTELEVYKVADGTRQTAKDTKPWRKTKEWNEKLLDELIEDIVAFKPMEDLNVKNARILMIGPVGAGKSSYYNTINSIFRGRITQRAGSGSAEQSLTTAYTPYKVKVRSGAALNFRLCDTRGLEDSQGLDVMECNYLLDGNIPNYYEFNPAKPIGPKSPGFKSKPTLDDMIQCAVFVLDATTLDVVSAKIIEKMKGFQGLMHQKGVLQVVLLTKIDKLCKDTQANVSYTYKSKAVEQHVDKASQLLGLPRANILPVKNYENELELDENVNILALLSLRQILFLAEDCMENMLEKRNDEREEEETLKHEH